MSLPKTPDMDEAEAKASDDGLSQSEHVQIKELLQKLPDEILAGVLAERVAIEPEEEITSIVKAVVSQKYSGPLPPPHMLEEYEHVQTGLADRIVSMAENEQKHRHSLETLAVSGEINKDRRGQRYALAVSLIIIIGSVGLIYANHEISGSVLAGGTLTGLAYIFITGRKKDDTDTDEK
jgi:uncharacterized membrane protein